MERKVKCIHCKKLKTLVCFGEVNMFWGNFKRCSWCKVCGRKLDKEHVKARKEFNKKCQRLKKEFVKNGGVLKRQIIGSCEEDRLPNGKLLSPACKGWYVDKNGRGCVINGIPINKMERVV